MLQQLVQATATMCRPLRRMGRLLVSKISSAMIRSWADGPLLLAHLKLHFSVNGAKIVCVSKQPKNLYGDARFVVKVKELAESLGRVGRGWACL